MAWTHHEGLWASNYNVKFGMVSGKTGNGSKTFTGVATGDAIQAAFYIRYSDAALKTTGSATVKVSAANTLSITGICSNSVVLFSWIDHV